MAKESSAGHDPKGRWETIEDLTSSEGAQAWIYRVRDSSGREAGDHIRKVLKNDKRADRFRIETKIMAALAKEGHAVVPVVDSHDVPDDRPYYVMPFYPKKSLRPYLTDQPFHPDLTVCLDLIEALIRSVAAVHDSNVTHRDLKPENILMDSQMRPWLCDFGLGRYLNGEGAGTAGDEQFGSRHYIAPEALGGSRSVSDFRLVDAYALSKIAYEIVSGKRLLGLQLPVGELDLSRMHPGEIHWWMLNNLIASLTAMDVQTRMSGWQRATEELARIRRRLSGAKMNDIDDALEKAHAAMSASDHLSEMEHYRKLWTRRLAYLERLRRAFSETLSTHSNCQKILTDPTLKMVAIDTTGVPAEWWRMEGRNQSPFPENSDRTGIPAPCNVTLRGYGHCVSMIMDCQWDSDGLLNLRLGLIWTREVPPGNAIRTAVRPLLLTATSASVDDETLLSEIAERVPKMLDDWCRWSLDCIEQIARERT